MQPRFVMDYFLILSSFLFTTLLFPQGSDFIKSQSSVNSSRFDYRLVKGDRSEILEFRERQWTSRKREVLNDTVLSNGISYKIIKWQAISNSANDLPNYEYQRIDSSGNVYAYVNNEDKLLYDFSKSMGETYPSFYEGKFWKVTDIYNVTGFNETQKAYDFQLTDSNSTVWMTETVIEKFGLTHLFGRPDFYTIPIEQKFWGAIIDNVTYGELLALDNKTEWRSYYPLSTGNFWKYEQPTAGFITTQIKEVEKDTVLYDGNVYKKIKSRTFLSSTPYSPSYNYERIDSLGNIFQYRADKKASVLRYRLSAAVGDTFYFDDNSYYRIDSKTALYDNMLKRNTFQLMISLKRSPASHDLYFTKDLGIVSVQAEGGSMQVLTGAVIDGKSYGDTTLITSVEEKETALKDFEILQAYPNPFNSSAKIRYNLKSNSQVSIDIYSFTGRKVARLINNQQQSSGRHEMVWNGKDENNISVSSGCYLIRLVLTDGGSEAKTINRKIVIMK